MSFILITSFLQPMKLCPLLFTESTLTCRYHYSFSCTYDMVLGSLPVVRVVMLHCVYQWHSQDAEVVFTQRLTHKSFMRKYLAPPPPPPPPPNYASWVASACWKNVQWVAHRNKLFYTDLTWHSLQHKLNIATYLPAGIWLCMQGVATPLVYTPDSGKGFYWFSSSQVCFFLPLPKISEWQIHAPYVHRIV